MANIPNKPANQSPMNNAQARAGILMAGVDRLQQIYSTATNPSNQTLLNIQPQNVGLIRGFLVKVSGTIANTNTGSSGAALARTNWGAANMIKNITFTDINNQTRHQTQGWHVNAINSAKQPMVMGGAYAPNVPVGYGNNYDVMTAPSSIAASGTTTAAVQFYYYIPLSYSKTDLRGAMWAGVVNATAQLQLEINPTPVVASGDAGLAVYSGNTGGWSGNVTVTVWQDYVDQIPFAGAEPILPQDDIATLYQLNLTSLTSLVAGQDFGVPFANFRQFLSTTLGYNNAGVYNAGTDINYFALQTANSSNIWKYGPEEASFLARSVFMADPPTGFYYFDHRAKPISTQNWGNTQITVNPSAVTSGAEIKAGFEYFAQASQVVFAGSLPSGG